MPWRRFSAADRQFINTNIIKPGELSFRSATQLPVLLFLSVPPKNASALFAELRFDGRERSGKLPEQSKARAGALIASINRSHARRPSMSPAAKATRQPSWSQD